MAFYVDEDGFPIIKKLKAVNPRLVKPDDCMLNKSFESYQANAKRRWGVLTSNLGVTTKKKSASWLPMDLSRIEISL